MRNYRPLDPEDLRLQRELERVVERALGLVETDAARTIIRSTANTEGMSLERMTELFSEASEYDQRVLVAYNDKMQDLYDAVIAHNKGRQALELQIAEACKKAHELDPTVRTVGDAWRVLKAHGINPGFSEEVLYMEAFVPDAG